MAKREEMHYQSIKIFDINVFSSSKESLLNLLRKHLEQSRPLLTVMTPNPEQVILSRNNKTFLDHLQSSDLNLPDGMGLVISSKLLVSSNKNQSLKERISGREVAEFLLKFATEKGLPVLVVGGREYGVKPETSQPAQLKLPQPYERAFWLEGYEDVQNPTEAEEKTLVAVIKKIQPAIVFVAFGAPWQEKWLVEHRELLESSGVKIAMAVGGAFDMILGKIPQAPAFMQTLGLEWLYRLLQEPWRWRRQLKLLEFIKLTFQSI